MLSIVLRLEGEQAFLRVFICLVVPVDDIGLEAYAASCLENIGNNKEIWKTHFRVASQVQRSSGSLLLFIYTCFLLVCCVIFKAI